MCTDGHERITKSADILGLYQGEYPSEHRILHRRKTKISVDELQLAINKIRHKSDNQMFYTVKFALDDLERELGI